MSYIVQSQEVYYKNTNPDQLGQSSLDVDNLQQHMLTEALRNKFQSYDKVWIVGHKGDQAVNLQEHGLLDVERAIDLVHVHSTLGVNAKVQLSPPEGSAGSYESILTEANPDLERYVQEAQLAGQRVLVLMPFPNQQFQEMLQRHGALDNFTLTAPVADINDFLNIENKIVVTDLINEALASCYPENIIPYTFPTVASTWEMLQTELGIYDNRGIYMQVALSAGGDGTRRVSSAEEYSRLLEDPEWKAALVAGRLKATKEMVSVIDGEFRPAYPANGSGCIVKNPDGTCSVYVDPLSHKPVGLPELNAKQGSGVGNDWGIPFPEEVQEQYLKIVENVGKLLYERFGYTGMFGPDCIVVQENGKLKLHITEINPRWQGTTPYQSLNATMNGRLPLEILHYAQKLLSPEELANVLPDNETYNRQSVNEKGGFYIKVGGPKERQEVKQDLNGVWLRHKETGVLIKPQYELPLRDVYTGSYAHAFPEHDIVFVKAPRKGAMIGGELAPVGYIVGQGIQVFSDDVPGVTPAGQAMYNQVINYMFA